MKSIKCLFTTLFLTLVFVSCETEDKCEGIACTPPPVSFSLAVVDEQTGENLFTSGRFEYRDIRIENLDGESADFELRTASDLDHISVLLGWGSRSDTLTVEIGDDIAFEISFVMVESTGGCCSSTRLEELTIEGIEFEKIPDTGIIKILVNTEE